MEQNPASAGTRSGHGLSVRKRKRPKLNISHLTGVQKIRLRIEFYECTECTFQHGDLEDFLEHVRDHAYAKEISNILEEIEPLSVIDDGEFGEDLLEDLMASLPQDMDLKLLDEELTLLPSSDLDSDLDLDLDQKEQNKKRNAICRTSRDTFDDIFPDRHVGKGRPKSKQSNGRHNLTADRHTAKHKGRQSGPKRNGSKQSKKRKMSDTEQSDEEIQFTDSKKVRQFGGPKAGLKSRKSKVQKSSETEQIHHARNNEEESKTFEKEKARQSQNNNDRSKLNSENKSDASLPFGRPCQSEIENPVETTQNYYSQFPDAKYLLQPVIKLVRHPEAELHLQRKEKFVRKRGRPAKVKGPENLFSEVNVKKEKDTCRAFQIVLERCDNLVSNQCSSNTVIPSRLLSFNENGKRNGQNYHNLDNISESLATSRPRRSVKRNKFYDADSDDSMHDASSDVEIPQSKRLKEDLSSCKRSFVTHCSAASKSTPDFPNRNISKYDQISSSDYEPSTDTDNHEVTYLSTKRNSSGERTEKKQLLSSPIRLNPFFSPAVSKYSSTAQVILRGQVCPHCRNFRSTVATLLDVHLNNVHQIRRPGTFSCSSDFSPKVEMPELNKNILPNSSPLTKNVLSTTSYQNQDSSNLADDSTSVDQVTSESDDEKCENGLTCQALDVLPKDSQANGRVLSDDSSAFENHYENVFSANVDLVKVISNGHPTVIIPKLQQKEIISSCEKKDILCDSDKKDRLSNVELRDFVSDINLKKRLSNGQLTNTLSNSQQHYPKPNLQLTDNLSSDQRKDTLSSVQLEDKVNDAEQNKSAAHCIRPNLQLKERFSNGDLTDILSSVHLKDTLSNTGQDSISQSENAKDISTSDTMTNKEPRNEKDS